MRSLSEKKRAKLEASGIRLGHNSTLRAPSAPIRKKPRKPSEFARIYGSRERVRWVKSHRCAAADCVKSCGPCEGEIQNAHTVGGGMGLKAGAETIVPLCARHHAMYDQHKAPFDTIEARAVIIGVAAALDLSWTTRTP